MQRYILVLVICAGVLCGGGAYGETSVSIGSRYDMCTDDQTPETVAYEITIPLGLRWRWKGLVLAAEGAYAHANVSGGEETARLSSFTDTRISASYVLPDFPVGLIVGVDVNLPSGTATLTESERNVEIGENGDLFEVDDFGEGFNIGPSIGIIKELGPINLGAHIAYFFRGEYTPMAETPDESFDPGDQGLGFAYLRWQAARWLLLDGSVGVSWFGEETLNGEPLLQEGVKVNTGFKAELHYTRLQLLAQAQHIFQAKNREAGEDGSLITESENSNGPEFFGLLELRYKYDSSFTFRLLGDLRVYSESERKDSETDLPYRAQRIRYAGGLGFMYSIREHLALNTLIKYVHLERERDIFLNDELTIQGSNVAIGLTYTF